MVKRGFLLTVATVFACFSIVCSQERTPISFKAIVFDKVFDGTDTVSVRAVDFFEYGQEDKLVGLSSTPFDSVHNPHGDYEILGVRFNSANVNEATEVSVTLRLRETTSARRFELVTPTLSFPKKISPAKAYIQISVENIIVGETPKTVIDTMNLIDSKNTWKNSLWIENNIDWRFAQMNMEQDISLPRPDNEADPIPAWRSALPTTEGTYWVEAIFKGNDNYLADTSKIVVFNISRFVDNNNLQPVALQNISTQNAVLGFAGIKNGEINLSLQAGFYTIEIYNLQGRLIARRDLSAGNGINATGLRVSDLARGMLILNVRQAGTSVLQHKMIVK